MTRRNPFYRAITALCAALLSVTVISCFLKPASTSSASPATPSDAAALKMQSLVMSMADDYIAYLGESVYLLARSGRLDPRGRWLAQSFLRNGVGASLDIAVDPNPAVNLLDLLVLTSLETWSFETHWIPAGIGEAGIPALERLKRAEKDIWKSAGKILSEDQLRDVRGLIDAWIAENRDRTVVALVRFEEFADERRISSLALRAKARGLLKDVSKAIAVVDDTRLLGERLLWFAGRYPYVLGEQTELTAYRLLDQPEGTQLMAAIKSAQQLSETLTQRMETIQDDLEKQQAGFFSKVSAERTAAIMQLQDALEATVKESLDRASESIQIQRAEAINQFFDRFAQERTAFLDDLASRQNELLKLLTELSETIAVSGGLARDLTETVNAIDRVVSRFDVDPEDKGEPLRMTDVRDAAIETGRAADRVTLLLEQVIELFESKSWDERLSSMTQPANAVVDRMFWRGAVLICLLIVGLGLLRWVPRRVRNATAQGPL